jgi:hypothetical protein
MPYNTLANNQLQMNYTPEQISSIVLKVLKEIETPDVSSPSYDEKIELAQNPNTSPELLKVLATDEDWAVCYAATRNPNYKKQTLELTSTQYEALKKLIESGQDESLKGLMDT